MRPVERQPESGRRGRKTAWLSWLYLTALLAVWALLAAASDEWWPATLVMFLPRWIWGVPVVVLGLAAAALRPRLLWVLLAGAAVVAWPLMGLCIPWPRPPAAGAGKFRCRVLTCNVHRHPFGVRAAVAQAGPDLVALQDCPERLLGPKDFGDGDWHVQGRGQFLLASRYPIREFTELTPPDAPADTAVRARLETPAGPVRFYILHLASPRRALVAVRQRGWAGGEQLQANSDLRRSQSAAIDAWIGREEGPLLVAGDFNTPCESTIYGAFWSKYTNAFSAAGLGWGYTYYANRTALRIDHILAGPGWRCRDCWVGPEVGSEHRPLIADLEWLGRGP
jgi:endonuclease/exonuclease/phosphatase family metal-dependent hydrolase